jgi:hypothetical protein
MLAPPTVLATNAIGKAVGNVGGVLGQIGEAFAKEEYDRAIGNLKIEMIRDLGKLESDLAKDTNYATHPARFAQGIKDLGKKYQSGVGPKVWKDFEPLFGQFAARTGQKIQGTAYKKQVDASKAQLNSGLDQLTKAYGDATSDDEREQIKDFAQEIIEGRAATSVISQVEATNRLRSWTSGITETKVRQDLFLDPEGTETALLRGGYKELTPEKRVVWLERATAKVEAARALRVRVRDSAEKDAAKALKVVEEQTGKDGYELLAKRKLTLDWIIENEDKLSKSDYKMLLDKAMGDDTTEDNVDVVADLYGRVATEDVGDEAIAAFKRGDLKRATLGAIISRNDKIRGNQGPKQSYKRAQSYINTSLGVNELANIPGQRRRLADAVMDFDAWVEANPDAKSKDILETSRRIVREYSIIDWNRMSISLPMPSWFVGSRQAPDLDATKQSLVDRFMAKHGNDRDRVAIDPEYQRAVSILRRWEEAVKKRDLSTGATQQ